MSFFRDRHTCIGVGQRQAGPKKLFPGLCAAKKNLLSLKNWGYTMSSAEGKQELVGERNKF
jgi:hypothetical protein